MRALLTTLSAVAVVPLLLTAVWAVRRAITSGFRQVSLLFAALAAVLGMLAFGIVVNAAGVLDHVGALDHPRSLVAIELALSVAALAAGVFGYLVLTRSGRTLEQAIEVVANLRAGAVAGYSGPSLTPRERQVVRVVAEGGWRDEEIAVVLGMAPSTAATHVRNVLAKTGLHDRRDLVLIADVVAAGERSSL